MRAFKNSWTVCLCNSNSRYEQATAPQFYRGATGAYKKLGKGKNVLKGLAIPAQGQRSVTLGESFPQKNIPLKRGTNRGIWV